MKILKKIVELLMLIMVSSIFVLGFLHILGICVELRFLAMPFIVGYIMILLWLYLYEKINTKKQSRK